MVGIFLSFSPWMAECEENVAWIATGSLIRVNQASKQTGEGAGTPCRCRYGQEGGLQVTVQQWRDTEHRDRATSWMEATHNESCQQPDTPLYKSVTLHGKTSEWSFSPVQTSTTKLTHLHDVVCELLSQLLHLGPIQMADPSHSVF